MFFQKKLDRSADICFVNVDYKHISRRLIMADFFLSNLKSTLDSCITELDEFAWQRIRYSYKNNTYQTPYERNTGGILTPIPYFSLLPILILLMKTACITILNSVLYVFALIMEPRSVLPPIFQKKNFLWKKSINFTGCAGARKQASVNSNTPSQ